MGANKYNNGNINKHSKGKKSKKKVKKSTSAIKKIEPGKPKNIKQFTNENKKSLGHKKFKPLISVINLVLNLLLMASTKRNEFEDSRAWLINIQKLESKSADCPLISAIVSQCISTTVE